MQVQASIMERNAMYQRLKHLGECLSQSTQDAATSAGLVHHEASPSPTACRIPILLGQSKQVHLDRHMLESIHSWLRKDYNELYQTVLQ